MNINSAVLVISLVLQVAVLVFALRLIRITKSWLAWSLLALGFSLMAFLRFNELSRTLIAHGSLQFSWATEFFRLAISGSLLAGIVAIRPILLRFMQETRAAEESKERFKVLSQNSMLGLYIVQDGKLVFVNPALCEMSGYTLEELLGQPFQLLVYVEDLPVVAALAAHRLANDNMHSKSSYRAISKQGAIFYVDVYGALITYNGKPALMGNVLDVTTRATVEAALHNERQFMRTMLENMGDGMIACNSQGMLVQINRTAREWNAAEKIGAPKYYWAREYLLSGPSGEELSQKEANPIMRSLAGEIIHQEVFTIKRENTPIRYVLANGSPLSDDTGGHIGAVIVMHDITELRNAREALERSLRYNRSLFVASIDPLLTLDLQGRITDVNPACEALTGLRRTGLLGHKIQTFLVQNENSTNYLSAIISKGFAQDFELTLKVDNKPEIPLLCSGASVKNDQGASLGVFVSLHDMSSLKAAESEIRTFNTQLEQRVQERTSEVRLMSRALEDSPATVVITDPLGVIQYANPQFTISTGYSVAEVLGQNPRILKSGVHEPTMYKAMWEQLGNGLQWRGEICNRRKDGSLYWEAMSIAPVKNEHGNITNFVAVKEDITTLKQLEKDLLQAKEQAETANRAKSIFLANMSHEIRTPLNAILGFSQILRRSQTLEPLQKTYVETINQSGEHLLSLINEILELSKIEAGRSILHLEPIDLFNTIDEIDHIFRMRADAKHIAYQVDGLSQVPRFIISDQNKIRQILINLIGNAMKFTEKGSIKVHARSEHFDDTNFMLYFDIQDTGTGIAAEEIPRLFQQFEQSMSGEKAGGGTGLGLAISRQLARMMGGDVVIQSELGVGSTFTVSVKAQISDSERALKHIDGRCTIAIKNSSKIFRVLIVDDKIENQKLLAQMLEPLQFSIELANNGKEAVEFAQQDFDLILMDLRMPIMDGIEAIQHIRESGNACKIIMLSASAFEETRIESLRVGANEFIGKPFREMELFEKIGALLQLEYFTDDDSNTQIPTLVPELSEPLPTYQDSEKAIALLSYESRHTMYNAVLAGDFDLFEDLISNSKLAPKVLQHLRILAKAFDSQALQDLFSN